MKVINVTNEYELRLDEKRNIVYEVFKGMFTKQVIANMENDYKSKIMPLLKGKKWAKHCDMRNYKLANAQDELNNFVGYCMDNGMNHAALIVESAIVKMQMNRVGNNVGVHPVAFTGDELPKAENYLKESGY